MELDDKDLVKINGIVEKVVFQNSENSFTVIEINYKGELISAVGLLSDIAVGEEVTLCGTWEHHSVFGRQFKITSCERHLPDNAAKLYKYLASGTIKGIGPKIALKIIEKFGEDSIDVLENDPGRLAGIPGISPKKAIDISNEFCSQFAMRKIIIELENYGIKPTECTSIYKYFGANAVQVVKDNPYILCGTIKGFDFEKAELLSSKFEVTPKAEYRNFAGIIHILKHNLKNGHTCIPKRKIYDPAKALLDIDELEFYRLIDELILSKQLVSAMINNEEYIFLPELYRAEMLSANKLNAILRFPPAHMASIDEDIDYLEKRNNIKYAEKQKEAIKTAYNKGLLVLTGGPGTGKTTVLKGIIDLFEKMHVNVLLCAPTGMAAKRLSQVTDHEAKTIHRLLEVEWDASDKPFFRKCAEDPLKCGALIIDEMSMVDVELFSSLMEAVPIGCRLILVGDPEQLPSVGPGNVLKDIINSEKLPVIALTEIFRQAQESLIVVNSHKIVHGEQPVLFDKKNDFFFIKREDSMHTANTVCELFSKRLPNAYNYNSLEDIQILCPSKKGDCGTENLNRKLQASLNPPAKSKIEIKTPSGRIFREGDRVMQIKNNYKIPWTKGYEEGEGVFNGDIGLLVKINITAGFMKILFDDRETEYPTDNLSELELAYAVTVHKSQGSEYPAVILPIMDCQPMLLFRNLLYTAVTRAKQLLIIVGDENKVTDMVNGTKVKKRYSALKTFLTE